MSLQKIVRSREEGARVQGCSIFVSGAEGDQKGRPHRQALGPPRPRRCRRFCCCCCCCCCCPPRTVPGRSSVRGGAQHSHHQRILLSVTNCSASFLPRTPWHEFWRGQIGIPISSESDFETGDGIRWFEMCPSLLPSDEDAPCSGPASRLLFFEIFSCSFRVSFPCFWLPHDEVAKRCEGRLLLLYSVCCC
jgi:hypothetical protein